MIDARQAHFSQGDASWCCRVGLCPLSHGSKAVRDHQSHLFYTAETKQRVNQWKSCWSCVARAGTVPKMKISVCWGCDAPFRAVPRPDLLQIMDQKKASRMCSTCASPHGTSLPWFFVHRAHSKTTGAFLTNQLKHLYSGQQQIQICQHVSSVPFRNKSLRFFRGRF